MPAGSKYCIVNLIYGILFIKPDGYLVKWVLSHFFDYLVDKGNGGLIWDEE